MILSGFDSTRPAVNSRRLFIDDVEVMGIA